MPTVSSFDASQVATELIGEVARYGDVVIAFSGGVDSAVVAAAAKRATSIGAIAVMAISPSLPERQIELATNIADEIGIPFRTIATHETDLEDYRRNDSRRCFFCKETLYASLSQIAGVSESQAILSGTNADDLGDYRPGIQAGREASVKTPLADLGITKAMVRELAQHWELSNWDLPAGPCLSSRIAYGEPVTVAKLRMIDQAENFLRDEGFPELRVRLHPGLLARIEVPLGRIGELVDPDRLASTTKRLREIGFQFISVDLEGLRSGNLNQLVMPVLPKRPSDVR